MSHRAAHEERQIHDSRADGWKARALKAEAETERLKALLLRWVQAADDTGGEVWCGIAPNDELLESSIAATGWKGEDDS